jgi:cellulose synthase/poly-beta-1,6-N-acetylglucosamine synthase-like glycosyltransferase
LRENLCVYSYGRQIGSKSSRFSECQIFKKYYPDVSQIPQHGYFCNNANAALKRDVWEVNQFKDELTGLEDMELAKRLISRGYKVGYVAEAPIYHIHDESWRQVHRRYERESRALQSIMPEVHISVNDFLRYYTSAVLLDMAAAIDERQLLRTTPEIFIFRVMQFWGAYQGNHEVREMSHKMKEKYFFPKS